MSDWFDEARSGGALELPAVLDATVLECICDVVGAGALVSLGTTSDGGAVGCTVTCDGRWRREYFRNAEDLSVWLRDAADAVRRVSGDPSASSARRSRSRRPKAS